MLALCANHLLSKSIAALLRMEFVMIIERIKTPPINKHVLYRIQCESVVNNDVLKFQQAAPVDTLPFTSI